MARVRKAGESYDDSCRCDWYRDDWSAEGAIHGGKSAVLSRQWLNEHRDADRILMERISELPPRVIQIGEEGDCDPVSRRGIAAYGGANKSGGYV